eukprot:1666484-Rhodomonas_salina.8
MELMGAALDQGWTMPGEEEDEEQDVLTAGLENAAAVAWLRTMQEHAQQAAQRGFVSGGVLTCMAGGPAVGSEQTGSSDGRMRVRAGGEAEAGGRDRGCKERRRGSRGSGGAQAHGGPGSAAGGGQGEGRRGRGGAERD